MTSLRWLRFAAAGSNMAGMIDMILLFLGLDTRYGIRNI
jgi:hypothetical protein